MNRRNFLKLIPAAAIVPVVLPKLKVRDKKENLKKLFLRCVAENKDTSEIVLELIAAGYVVEYDHKTKEYTVIV